MRCKCNVLTHPELQSCTTSEDEPGQRNDEHARVRVLKHRLLKYEHVHDPHSDQWGTVVVAIVVVEVVCDGVDVVVCSVVAFVVVVVTVGSAFDEKTRAKKLKIIQIVLKYKLGTWSFCWRLTYLELQKYEWNAQITFPINYTCIPLIAHMHVQLVLHYLLKANLHELRNPLTVYGP